MRRKFLLLLIIFSASALSFNCQTTGEKVKPCKYLSFTEAEKILGRSVELVTNSWTFTTDITRFDCTYRTIEKVSGQEVNLFFTLEESSDEMLAQKIYADIWNSNKNHKGTKTLNGIGDEAYSHSDQANFHFILVRKEKFTIRLKVSKTSETNSFEELKAFAKKVVERI